MKHSDPHDTQRSQPTALGAATYDPLEEVLIPDARAGMSPSDMVDRKLQILLRGSVIASNPVRTDTFRMRGARPTDNHLQN